MNRNHRVVIVASLLVPLVIQPAPARAEPYLVVDANTTASATGSFPRHFHLVDAGAIFVVFDGPAYHEELWLTDGTPAGTRRLVEISPEPSAVNHLAEAGGLWYYTSGSTLWRTDGTADGTLALGQIAVPAVPEGSERLTAWVEDLGLLFFVGASPPGSAHLDLWRTDGTPGGTRRVTDLGAAAVGVGIQSLAGLRSSVLFSHRASDGDELWVSDGTPAGTELLRDGLLVAPPLTASRDLAVFFARRNGIWNLWRSDGTLAGTTAVTALFPGPTIYGPRSEVAVRENDFIFVADDVENGAQLWRSDGTAAGTTRLSSLADGFGLASCSFTPRPWVVSGDTVFWALRGISEGCELWRSDGTAEGTGPLLSCPGDCGSHPADITPIAGGRVLFSGDEPGGPRRLWVAASAPIGEATLVPKLCPGSCDVLRIMPFGAGAVVEVRTDAGASLWMTDGTPAGTRRLTDHYRDESYARPPGAVVDETLVFSHDDGETGFEPWSTGGTQASTSILIDVAAAETSGSQPEILSANGDRVYFVARTERGPELWTSDGTPARSRPLEVEEAGIGQWRAMPFRDGVVIEPDLQPNGGLWFSDGEATVRLREVSTQSLETALVTSERLYFVEASSPWATDGTAAGTVQLLRPEEGLLAGAVSPDFGELGGHAYFLASGAEEGLWRTDGTAAGTELVLAIPDAGLYPSGAFLRYGDRLAFVAGRPFGGEEVWLTDGTAEGTASLAALGDSPRPLAVVGSTLLIRTQGSGSESTLWRTDGTVAGTSVLLRLQASPDRIVVADGLGYFVGVDLTLRTHLYRTDGTPGGTLRLLEDSGHFTDAPLAVGDLVYFTLFADEPPYGKALWRSDGTSAGTFRIRTFVGDPPFPNAVVVEAADVGHRLLFSAGTTSSALFVTDGTVAGTHAIDLPSSVALVPLPMRRAGDRIFFAGRDEPHGSELWALPVADVVEADPHALGLGPGARFEVEVDWVDYDGEIGRGTKAPLRVDDSGLFWFFGESNWELLVKVLDACDFDGHHWVFASAATSVGYTLKVTDTATGEVRTYSNPVGQQAPPIVDTGAFSCGPETTAAERRIEPPPPKVDDACPPGVLCLRDGRFRVSMSWRRADGLTGTGKPVPGTSESGLFWFFDDDNWEALVKVLDGCAITGRYWVFAAAVTTVEFTLRIEDTVTREVAEYRNELGQEADAVTDTAALDVCP